MTTYTYSVCISRGAIGRPEITLFGALEGAKDFALRLVCAAHQADLAVWDGAQEDTDGIEMESAAGESVIVRGHIVREG